MKRHVLLAATVLTVALTAALFLTVQCSRGAGRLPRHREAANLPKSRDPHLDQAARRCFHGDPRHWRDCLLQR